MWHATTNPNEIYQSNGCSGGWSDEPLAFVARHNVTIESVWVAHRPWAKRLQCKLGRVQQ
jgi:hypothetical protein